LEGEPGDTYTDATYGPLKVLCERAAQSAFPGAALVIRPGIVVGPHDASQRFGYWVRRLMRGGGRVLGPQRPDQPVQLVHARDQADFLLAMLASGTDGVFNTVGPDDPMTFQDVIGACAAAAGVSAEVVWAPDKFLRENQVNLPLGLPASGRWDGVFRRSNARAKVAGFRNRSISETAVDTLAWERGREEESRNLSASREAELLALL
jgi:2'-hydroxyisoflavone reductase